MQFYCIRLFILLLIFTIIITEIYDIAIVGGGLAGLTTALHLSQKNFKVILFDKNNYPHHKVCGEYVSNEVLP